MTKTGPPHLAMLVTPGMGHLIPLAELAKRLASRHGATATLITFASTASATQRALLASLPPSVASRALPPVDLSDLPRDAAIETLMSEECARSLPAFTAVLSELNERTRLVAFVTDQFGVAAFGAARHAGVRSRCLFMPTNLHALSLVLHLPELAASVPGEFRDLDEPVRLPGCVPIPGSEIVSPLQDRSNPSYALMVRLAVGCREADTVLVNSFDAVEPHVRRGAALVASRPCLALPCAAEAPGMAGTAARPPSSLPAPVPRPSRAMSAPVAAAAGTGVDGRARRVRPPLPRACCRLASLSLVSSPSP